MSFVFVLTDETELADKCVVTCLHVFFHVEERKVQAEKWLQVGEGRGLEGAVLYDRFHVHDCRVVLEVLVHVTDVWLSVNSVGRVLCRPLVRLVVHSDGIVRGSLGSRVGAVTAVDTVHHQGQVVSEANVNATFPS